MRGRPLKLSATDLARVLAPDHPPDVQLARELKVHRITLWYARQRAQGRDFYLENLIRKNRL